MKCPGQDRRNWTPDDVSEVDCARCGAVVEFFKTDGARNCPGCGARVVNPKVAAGCAQWCAAAKQCLGFDPQTVRQGKAGRSLADALLEAAQEELSPPDLSRARSAGDAALQMALERGADPRVALAATVLDALLPQEGGEEDWAKAMAALQTAGFDEETAAQVRTVLAAARSGAEDASGEALLVREAGQSGATAHTP